MPARNFVSFAPFGAAIVVVLMLLATELANHRNEYACALGTTACREAASPAAVAAQPLAAGSANADRVAGLIQSSDGGSEAGPATWRLSLYLLGASLALLVAALAVVVVVARRQHRLALAQQATDDGKAANNERIIKLVESVATVIRALEERTRELEAGVKAFSGGSAAHEKGLVTVATVLEQVRRDQLAGGELAAESVERLDGAMAAAAEEVANSRQTLVDELLPSIARRDERLIAIDANLTAVTERLTRLAADIQHNAEQTAVLAEIVRALEKSVSDLTSGLIGVGEPPPRLAERPPEVAARPMPAQAPGASHASDEAAGSTQGPIADESAGADPRSFTGSGPERPDSAPAHGAPADDAPDGPARNDA